MFAFAPVVSSAAAFPDTAKHPFRVEIEELKTRGYVQGYEDGNFRPDATLNRAEFVRMLAGLVPGENRVLGDRHCFVDFSGEAEWFWIYACSAKERGIIQGYPNGTFGGANKINIAEALKMTVSAFKAPLPVYAQKPSKWYVPYVDAAASLGVTRLPEDPGHLITRGEMAYLLVTFDHARKAGKLPE